MMPCFQRHFFLLYHVRGTRLKKGYVRIHQSILNAIEYLPVSLTSKPVFFVLLLETNLMLRLLLLDVSFL